MEDPRAAYGSRLADRRSQVTRWARAEERLGTVRLVCAVVAAVLAWLAFGRHTLDPAWLALPAVAFVALVVRHARVREARARAERAAAFYARGLARLDGTWMGGGELGTRFQDPAHPYADDLDLFGHGSLFELLCTARTRAGEDTLAAWLCAPAVPDDVRARQVAIAELRPRLDLREDLALLGADVRAGVDPAALRAWADAAPVPVPAWAPVAAAALAVAAVAGAIAWWLEVRQPLVVVGGLEALLALVLRRRVGTIVRAVDRPARDLVLLSQLLARLEAERFTAPLLVTLRAALDAAGLPPSRQVDRLRRRIDLLDARRNQLFAPIGWLLLWTTQLALAIERWRRDCGPAIPRWLATVGELEALCALAGFAYEHPGDPFPELASGPARFEGDALAHPLLHPDHRVANDVHLGTGPRAFVVSGSNMSGKSTMLRTVGVHAVLAQAGSVVPARALRLSPLAVGASIRLQDSLHAGTSRFYAEVKRVKQLVDLAAGATPLLFLLDELFAGTNSHDRQIGAGAVVRGLVERGALGLVTTHDLALARIADELGDQAANVHFEDQLTGGELQFDYRMRPGVVRRSNALELMRAVGLEV